MFDEGYLHVMADERAPENGGSHEYMIGVTYEHIQAKKYPAGRRPDGSLFSGEGEMLGKVSFQNGPIKESGVNGVTNEVLLRIVQDRLEGFQTGEYKCRENAIAITKIEEALHWLRARTAARQARGVEGRNIP